MLQARMHERGLEEHHGVGRKGGAHTPARRRVIRYEEKPRSIAGEAARTREQERFTLVAQEALIVANALAAHVPQPPPNLHTHVVPALITVAWAPRDQPPALVEGGLKQRRQPE